MNSENVSIVQGLYDAFARGDVDAVLGTFDPNIEWREAESFIYAEGNPYVGPQAVLQGVFGRIAGDWDNFRVELQEALPTPDGAVTLGRYSGTYKATGRAVHAQFAHVWKVRGGKISGFQQYTDTAQFSRATAQ
jgi:ketosteroid isomerase-like protein